MRDRGETAHLGAHAPRRRPGRDRHRRHRARVPSELRHRILEPFFTTKAVGKGTGQGLTIAHNVGDDKHGGTMTFDGEPGRGTTFYVRIPIG